MSIDPCQPASERRNPPFWDLDGRYHPPSEIGEIPFDELPGHLELPRVGRGCFLTVTAPWLRWYDLQETQEPTLLTEE